MSKKDLFKLIMNKKIHGILFLSFYLTAVILCFNHGYYFLPVILLAGSAFYFRMAYVVLEGIIFILIPIILFMKNDGSFTKFITRTFQRMNEPLEKALSGEYIHKPFVYENDDEYEPHGPNLDPRLRVKRRTKEYVPKHSDELEDIKTREIPSDEYIVKKNEVLSNESDFDENEISSDTLFQKFYYPKKVVIDKNADWYSREISPRHKYTKEEIEIITYERPPPRRRRIKQHSDSNSWEDLSTSSYLTYCNSEDPRVTFPFLISNTILLFQKNLTKIQIF